MSWQPERRLVTIAEAAKSVDRPESTVRRWLAEGRLKSNFTYDGAPLVLESHALRVDAEDRRRGGRPKIQDG
ncbi:hypothetical protein GCM10027053_51770 [Intrasporangium mesophilum]